MAPNINDYESIVFNPFEGDRLSQDDERDPDINFFDISNTHEFNCSYFNPDEINTYLSENGQHENITALHVNIRSIKHNFETFHDFLGETKSIFNVLCLTETWSSDEDIRSNSALQISGFNAIPYERKTKKRGEGVLIYLAKNLMYRLRDDLSISDGDKEILTIEIINKDNRNTILSCCYKPPSGDSENLSIFLKGIFEKSNSEKKIVIC